MDEPEDFESNSEQLNNLEIKNNSASDFYYFLFDLLKTGVIVFILAFSLRYFVIRPFIVEGESMMPNYTNDEYLFAERVSYLFNQPKRGDVVIFQYPGNPNVNYIKRVIGLPGETVQIANNKVTIDNQANPGGIVLKEDYLSADAKTLTSESGVFEKKLSPGEYFVMGDNRQHSSDSREWGVLPQSNILGRAWLTVRPHLTIHRTVAYPTLLSGSLLRLELKS